ncbi:hypothetical protein ACRQ5D_16645 [Mucilaginibacter sp. P25]|uniref:hypothetical protein n=1 Tax=Mucilaginibacter sp. P25 TaxID=3423945 RepID=UPI003D7AEEA8
MKNKKHLLLFVLGMLMLPGLLKAQGIGKPVLFNAAWSFHKGDISTGISGIASETQWRTVDLPHDWSIEGPFSDEWASATGYLPGGLAGTKRVSPVMQPGKRSRYIFILMGYIKTARYGSTGII